MIDLCIALMLLLLWGVLFYPTKKRRNGLWTTRREGDGILAPFLFIGIRAMGWISDDPDLWYRRRLRRSLHVLVDPYALPTVLRRTEAQMLRDLFLMVPLAMPCFFWNPGLLPVILLACVARLLYQFEHPAREAKRVMLAVNEDLIDMLTRFILALGAGALPLVAWREIAGEGEGVLYEEMNRVSRRLDAGESLRTAIGSMSARFSIEGMRECTQLFGQSMEVGGKELAGGLSRIRTKLLEERARNFAIEAERASQRMLFPSLLLFVGILLLVMVPMIGRGL